MHDDDDDDGGGGDDDGGYDDAIFVLCYDLFSRFMVLMLRNSLSQIKSHINLLRIQT